MPFQKGENQCKYLPQRSTEFCNKSCRGEYCAFHNQRIRSGYKVPNLCLSCGIGMRGNFGLCVHCGGKNYRAMLYYYEKRSSERKIRKKEAPTIENFTEIV